MVEAKNPDETTHKRVSYRNIERIENIGKMGDTFNDVLTLILDDYEKKHKKRK